MLEATKKVLIVGPSLDMPGGVANYYREMLPALTDRADYLPLGGRNNKLSLIKDYLNIIIALLGGEYFLVQMNPSLRWGAVIRDGFLLLISMLARKKVVIFFRGWNESVANSLFTRWKKIVVTLLNKADHLVVLGESIEHRLRLEGVTTPISITTTVCPDFYVEQGRERLVRSLEASIPCTFLYISRLDKNKGLEEAIDILAEMISRGLEVKLEIAGEGVIKNTMERYVQENGFRWVRFLGYVQGEDKVNAYGRADVLIFPTKYGEGMPNMLMEAMGYGIPIVTRPVGGIPDVIKKDISGVVENDLSSNESLDKIESLILDFEKRKKIGKYNNNYANENLRPGALAGFLNAIWDCESANN